MDELDDARKRGADGQDVRTMSVRIVDSAGRDIYRPASGYRIEYGVCAIWSDDIDKAWLASSDGSIVVVERGADGRWAASIPGPDDRADAPSALVDEHPYYFDD